MSASEPLSSSLEDYLEAIYHLVSEKQTARVKDISQRLKVNKSSVTGALKLLAERKLINYAPYEHATLTPKGRRIARDVAQRHEALREFFIKVLSIDKKIADQAACKMEHEIPKEIMKRFTQFVYFIERCPRMGSDWIEGFGYHCHGDSKSRQCADCLKTCLNEIKAN